MKRYLIATLVLSGISLHAFDAKFEFRHRESQGVGYNQGYSTLEFMGNQNWEKFELLVNMRGHVFNNGKLAANAGLGLRRSLKSERYMLGLNAFYDVRQSHLLTAQQVGAGWEFLSKRADIRMNGYLPISKQSDYEQTIFSGFSGNTAYVSQHTKAALPCAEVELGIPFKSVFYLAGGPYYLFEKNVKGLHSGATWGGRVRGVVNITQYLSLSAVVTHDGIFDTRVQGYLSINVPIGAMKEKKPIKRTLRNIPLTRNEIIPIQSKHRKVPISALDASSGLNSFLFVNNAFEGEGKGTFEEPFASLKEAEQASKPGDIIYVFPGDGTTHNMDEGIVLKEGQTLTSSAESLQVDEIIIPAQTPNEKPVITNIHPNEPVIINSEGSYSESAFTIIDPSDYIFPDWDSPSYYDILDDTPLLGGDVTGDTLDILPDDASNDSWSVVDDGVGDGISSAASELDGAEIAPAHADNHSNGSWDVVSEPDNLLLSSEAPSPEASLEDFPPTESVAPLSEADISSGDTGFWNWLGF